MPFDDLSRFDPAPTREAGLARLGAFAPSTARRYAETRNYDHGPGDRSNLSVLSPYTRHRLVLERELAEAALAEHGAANSEKWIQEVCWRTYFKGWLEHRPAVWDMYLDGIARARDELERNAGLRTAYQEAIEGRTGIDAFDAWATELPERGYLANHSRMWFASIWIFTLKLDWHLGAEFFLRHLMDADAASNTLSWRWVAGLHTPGKTYLARPGNIRRYTKERFNPQGLAAEAPALQGDPNPKPQAPPPGIPAPKRGRIALLLHDDDLHSESLLDGFEGEVAAIAGATFAGSRTADGAGEKALAFSDGALRDGLERAEAAFGAPSAMLDADGFEDAALDWVVKSGADLVVTAEPPVGWTRPPVRALAARLEQEGGPKLVQVRRPWDDAFWPHAQKGFFGLKKKIPQVFRELGLPA